MSETCPFQCFEVESALFDLMQLSSCLASYILAAAVLEDQWLVHNTFCPVMLP